MNAAPIKVTLLYDHPGWVLHQIAEKMAGHAGQDGSLRFEVLPLPRKRALLGPIIANSDILHFMSPGLYHHFAPAIPRPTVVTLHHLSDKLSESLIRRRKYPDAMTAINQETEDYLRQNGIAPPLPVFRTPFGLDCDFWRFHEHGNLTLRKLLGVGPDAFLVGFAARPSSNEQDRKGVDRYWRVMEGLVEEHQHHVHLVIFGPGPKDPGGWQLDHVPKSLRPRIYFPSFQPSEMMPVYTSGLDVYLCLSRNEGGPHPVMEAMACERLVVSTAVGFVPELLREGVEGFLVDEGNYLTRVPEIIGLMRQGKISSDIGNMARRRVIEKRSWQYLVTPSRYGDVYTTAIRHYRRRQLVDKIGRGFRFTLATRKPWLMVNP